MAHRIEVRSKVVDARASSKKNYLKNAGFLKINKIEIIDVYTIDEQLTNEELKKIGNILTNPVTQEYTIDQHHKITGYKWVIEIGFLPGVTDNVGNTATESIHDLIKTDITKTGGVYSSYVLLIDGEIDENEAKKISENLSNPLINRVVISDYQKFLSNKEIYVPRVKLSSSGNVDTVPIINATDEELIVIGKKGIRNKDGTYRGPLSLDLTYMKAIAEYFKKLKRNPTDIELESIAQTWSEHCKHTIFADPLDEIKEGLYKTYIKGATNRIRKEKGREDFCVSVFTDNAGAIIFDDKYLVTDKVETHNSPSALDPFGGAITGIVGVNRDAMGFGMGAKPIINRYGFCFADPNDKKPLYKAEGLREKMLLPKQIMEGVIAGVNSGGNCSGIPTPQGFMIFDERYKGKPLVFVGTIGLIPRIVNNKESHTKSARAGDYIVMVGGRVGQDGIHGATFSSEAMDSGSPATAVQIGDPITQKKMSDAIIKEARDQNLYNSITDNGAGGLSCSVAEMGRECQGCTVELEKVPLKYPGLEPWKIWISESQERMTLSVPKEKWEQFNTLMKRRGVEATIIGEFNNSGRCVVNYKGKKIVDIDMEFLHDGLPQKELVTTYEKNYYEEPQFQEEQNYNASMVKILSRLNIASIAFISEQYDHEVQGGSVIKPLVGRGRVDCQATITRPILNSYRGVAISQGINPRYGDIDTYEMSACAIDTAIRNLISVGVSIDKIALLDNFCWCSSNEQQRLGQLKSAVRACYDYSVSYKTPFISGKDSMFNDFKGFNEKNEPIKISVPPTLLVSSIGIINDSKKGVTPDTKFPQDLVYLIGDTYNELGASEYFTLRGEETNKKIIGNNVPRVNAIKNKKTYEALTRAISEGLVASAQSVNIGGIGVALAKKAIGGKLGLNIDINTISKEMRDDYKLFSESQGRIIVSIDKNNKEEFEKVMKEIPIYQIGMVTEEERFVVRGKNGIIINLDLKDMEKSYKSTFRSY